MNKATQAQTYFVKIYIAGDMDVIRNECRNFCYGMAQCVTVTPTEYIYKGGSETGAEIGFINYPRFPRSNETLWNDALTLAERIQVVCCQHSFSLVAPDKTVWYSRRDD